MFPTRSVMMDLQGADLLPEEKDMLAHPLVGGLILFSRNFEDSKQLIELNKLIRLAANKPLLIAVDHEGGRVQRFKTDGFTHLPAMGKIYDYHQNSGELNVTQSCQSLGWLMAAECLAHDIDLSFAPVLDLDRGSDVIGDRSFHTEVDKVIELSSAWCQGVRETGMACIGKHFPGHGSVKEDSHIAVPVDSRSFEQIKAEDMAVFSKLISKDVLQGLMPAHVRFPAVDDIPVGYSKVWLQQILKKQLAFTGVLFSDDLSMVAAGEHLTFSERAELALGAGCDMALVCNNTKAAQQVLDNLKFDESKQSKVDTLIVQQKVSLTQLQAENKWREASGLAQTIKS